MGINRKFQSAFPHMNMCVSWRLFCSLPPSPDLLIESYEKRTCAYVMMAMIGFRIDANGLVWKTKIETTTWESQSQIFNTKMNRWVPRSISLILFIWYPSKWRILRERKFVKYIRNILKSTTSFHIFVQHFSARGIATFSKFSCIIQQFYEINEII